jgi:hypothetical protein
MEMKKSAVTILFVLFCAVLSAQITLEKTYNYSAATVKFETLGYKYFLMDVPNAECRIYNLDHSPFKTIPLSVPPNCYLADVKYLSENLFSKDPGIELVYTWYQYIPTQTSYYYQYGSRVAKEDGSIILDIEGARYVYLTQSDENTWKLFAYCYDYSVWPEKIWTNIYNLPGNPVFSKLLGNEKRETTLKAFPNPAENQVKIAYSLPEGIRDGTLFLFDTSGKMISRFSIDNHTDHLLLNVSGYQRGIYHYFIEYGNQRTTSEKLIVR